MNWKSNFYFIWLALLLGAIGMSACLPFLPLYIQELGVSDPAEAQTWAGLVFSAAFFCSALLTPFWGALGDRVGRRLMLLRAYVGVAIMTLLMGLAHNVWQLFFLRLAQGLVSGFVASSIALVAVTTPVIHVGFALGFLQTALSCGNIIGPLIGGLSADFFGIRPAFYFVSGLCLCSAAIIYFFTHEKPAEIDIGESIQSQTLSTRENIRFAFADRRIREILLFLCLCMLGLSASQPLMAFLVQSTGAPTELIGTVTGALVGMLGLLGIIFAPYWGRRADSADWRGILVFAAPIVGLSLFLQGLVTWYGYLFPLRFVMGLFSAAMLPLLFAALSRLTPQRRRGGIVALGSSATMLGQLISPSLAGWIAAHWGMLWAFAYSGTYFLILTLLLVKSKQQMHKVRSVSLSQN